VQFDDADGRPDGTTAAAQRAAAERGLLLLTCGAWGEVVCFIPAPTAIPDERSPQDYLALSFHDQDRSQFYFSRAMFLRRENYLL
jgi:hypothetical protein